MIEIVDIIIPTYKARETLPDALDSLVVQTKRMFLVTVVQDCDGEDYSDIIDEYYRRGLQIRLLCTPENGGPGVARQYGIDRTKCSFVMFMDSDDILFPQAVEILTKEIQTNGADVAMSDMVAEVPYQPSIVYKAIDSPVQWCAGKIYRTSFLRKNNIRFLPDLRLNEDSYFNLVVFNTVEKKCKIPRETYLWKYNKNSLTRQGEENDEFFKKSWYLYIYSQVKALEKIGELTEKLNPLTVAATLMNIYYQEMKAIHLKLDVSEGWNRLKEIIYNNKVWEAIDTNEFWEYIVEKLKCCKKENNEIYFFKKRFLDWINNLKNYRETNLWKSIL